MCVNNNGCFENLTKQSMYEVLEEDETEYNVKDNKGNCWYNKGRFERIKEDKQVKEYKLQEVINNIEDGEEYKSDSPLWEIKSIKKVNGNIKFIFNGAKNDSVGVNTNQRFIKVGTPVNFMNIIKSGKLCRIDHEIVNCLCKDVLPCREECINKDYKLLLEGKYLPLRNILAVLPWKLTESEFRTVLEEAKWYLEEN
jgi:hypothetical protein